MKLLIHGMQSSGATAFTLFLAQRPDCLALVDISNRFAAPNVSPALDMVAKTVITTAFPLAVHQDKFQPDKTILFLRDPRDNYVSLETKNYRDGSGMMEEKFAVLDQVFRNRSAVDAVIHYEDFVARDPAVLATVEKLGWPVQDEYYTYRRRHDAIFADLWTHLPHLFTEMQLVFGNVQGREVTDSKQRKSWDAEVEARLETLCPQLLAHYRARQ